MKNRPSHADTIFAHVDCEVRTDTHTRLLHATDASLYQLMPRAVAFPRSPQQAASVLTAAVNAGIPVTPRGAGTGLSGAAIGEGLIIDMARHARWIGKLDPDARTVRVGPGVVLDQLNDYLKPYGLCFGPDVATSARATLGGMIGNNSSGARAPLYGTTADHLVSLELVLADGTFTHVGRAYGNGQPHAERVEALIAPLESLIREQFHDGLVKRWPGYGLDRYLKNRGDLTRIISGSEGTLALMTAATLNLVPLPANKGLAVIFFPTVADAMQATMLLQDLRPAAIEHVDRLLFDRTRGQLAFEAARAFLGLDSDPGDAFLIVEFYDTGDGDVDERLAEVARRSIGLRTLICASQAEMNLVWNLRKAGLSLLTSMKGSAKPIEGLEDIAVRPDQLPDYVAQLAEVAKRHAVEVSFYGHAASGLLHVRPVIDLHREDGPARYRAFAQDVFTLVRAFHGSHAGEHGVGMSRAEFMPELVDLDLLDAMRRIKTLFDPRGLLNPGKIFPERGYRIETNLRIDPQHPRRLPFDPMLAFGARDGSLLANLEQCNGCGGCRKDAPTMCPTFIATGDEIMCTRGRTNTVRAMAEGRLDDANHPLESPALLEALDYCLSCKACKTECPSNVDMALMKAEITHARHHSKGLGLLERIISRFDLLGQLGTVTPGIANAFLANGAVRLLLEKALGLASQRPLPAYARQRFDRWFARRKAVAPGARGRVILWDDCSVRYHEPEIGQAAVAVLEAAGFEVVLPKGSKCCGRPAFSVGCLDTAKRFGVHNIALLRKGTDPIVFLEPSCYSMFAGDYAELKIPGADKVAARCVLFEQFVYNLLERAPDALRFNGNGAPVAIHGHCHAKALTTPAVFPKLAERVPGTKATLFESGCCGMAGSFGALRKKYALSLEVAKPLVEKIEALPSGTQLVASGTSCRQQIGHLTKARPLHMAQLLAAALARK